jgi:hypothetical protein
MRLRTCQEFVQSFSKATLICAAALCFALTPAAFAQRGGGGHGGGGHASGGHVGAAGSAHIGAAGAARGSRGSASAGRSVNGARSAYETAAMESRSGASTRGYTREVFMSGSGGREFLPASTRFVSANGNTTAVGTRAFAANNYFWEAPPQQARSAPAQAARPAMPLNQMARPMMMPPVPMVARPIYTPGLHTNPVAMPPIARAFGRPLIEHPMSTPSHQDAATGTPFLGDTPTPVAFAGIRPFQPFHPVGRIGTPCFDNIGACDSEFGFGFGSPFFFPPEGFGFGCAGFFNPCGIGFGPFSDLAFGLGYGDLGYGYGWGNGWFYPPAPEIPPPPENPTESNPPPDYSTGYFYLPEVPYSEPQANAQQPTIKLVLKDGTIFDVYSYWAQNDRLFYITTYNIKTSIPLDDLDLQKTVDLNQKLGVTFTLSNKPPDQQQPPEQQPPDGSGQ